jgi:phospholipase A1
MFSAFNSAEASSFDGSENKTDEGISNNLSDYLYRPMYLQPLYMTLQPFRNGYNLKTPANEGISEYDVKFQLSFKLPLVKNIFDSNTDIYAAYTQLSYWQMYDKSAFFRETDYEPELFLRHTFNDMYMLDFSINHQSNGEGGATERSWNRAIVSGTVKTGIFFFEARVWKPFDKKDSIGEDNPDLLSYMGYGSLFCGVKIHNAVLTFEEYNCIQSFFRKGTIAATLSFPLYVYYRGYITFFRGYGQSLYEYSHFCNSIGVGITMHDWM